MTKLNEEIKRTTLGEAVRYYTENAPRGEYVLIIDGTDALSPEDRPVKEMSTQEQSLSDEERVAYYEGTGLSRMDAIKAAAKDIGVSKSELYRKLNLK